MHGRSDEEIMAAYAGGDREAFRELFGRYAARLHGFLYHMTADRQLAQDLVQETFLRVHRARLSYDAGRPFKPWLFRIAANVQTDLARSWFWKLRARTVGLLDRAAPDAPAPADRIAARGPGPAERAESAQATAAVRGALDALGPSQRAAVLLHDLEGLTVREIAATLGAPSGTVLSWIRRGRAQVRSRLAAEAAS